MVSDSEKRHIKPILIALIVALLPQVLRLPLWITCWCIWLWGYMYHISRSQRPLPGRFTRRLLTGISMLGLILSFGYTIGGSAFISLIAVMAGLKPLEAGTHRDRMVAVFLSYFLIITNLIVFENLAITLYMFFSVAVTTAALIHINHPEGKINHHFQYSLRMVVQALPLMIILFLLFPRIQGSLWGIKQRPYGYTGFSNSLSLGDVARLVVNDDIAFRVEFESPVPGSEKLYWRGIVFWTFNGREWTRGYPVSESAQTISGKDEVSYIVTLEPRGNRWAFALDMPVDSPPSSSLMGDHTLRLNQSPRKKIRYRLTSYTSYNTGEMNRWEERALRLPPHGNEQSRQLAAEWRSMHSDDEALVSEALGYFRSNNFIYTLKPPRLGGNQVDDFLFSEKKGFCEHYAASFAFLMRASGIPARIVGGYMGGTMNPYGNYMIVHQSDAHAWVEVFLKGKGWVRIDPTSAVAPGRISEGVATALSRDELPAFLIGEDDLWLSDFWQQIKFGWDAISTQWDIWFISYSFWEQQALLAWLGIVSGSNRWLNITLLLVMCAAILFAAGFILFRASRYSGKKDRVQDHYIEFCKKLAQKGIVRRPAQGPYDYAKMIKKLDQPFGEKAADIIDLYVTLRYGEGGNAGDVGKFKIMVKNFRFEQK